MGRKKPNMEKREKMDLIGKKKGWVICSLAPKIYIKIDFSTQSFQNL